METVVEAKLRQQLRGITDEQVISTVDALRAAKIRVTAPLVNRILKGGGQSTSVRSLLALRFVATEEELRSLLREMIVQSERTGRRVPASTARDHVVICIAVLGRLTLQQAVELPVCALEEMIPALAEAAPRSRKKFAEFLLTRWSDYLIHVHCLPPERIANGKLYVASRGRSKTEGSGQVNAQIKLSSAMKGLDDRLARRVKVFWRGPIAR